MNIKKTIQLALQHHKSGNLQQAELIYRKIIKKQPNNFEALHFFGILCNQIGNYDSAIKHIKKSLQLNPNNANAFIDLGNACRGKGNLDEAMANYQKALQINGDNADAYNNRGVTFKNMGQFDEAITSYHNALRIKPYDADILYNLGVVFIHKEQINEAIAWFQKALLINPQHFNACKNLGNALYKKGRFDEAISSYQKAIQLDKNDPEVYINYGLALQDKGHIDEAINCYQKALQLNPMFAEAYFYLGNAFQHKGQSDNAVTFYQKALQSNPNFAEAYNNMGIAFVDQDRKNEAITCYQKALQIKPDYSDSYSNIVDQLRQTCNWQELTSIAAKLDGFTRKALDNGTKPVESPFHNITRHAELSLNLAIAKSWSCEIDRDMSFLKTRFPFDGIRTDKQKKFVIGYLSNEFLDHATAHLMLSLFGLHNRDNFDIYCYSYGKDDGSSYRARIQHDCDRFVDIASLNYDAAARCIYDDHVDILVDLKGYTTGNRLAICALRPAPVQVSYLGFPGSTGADFLDYIITDKIVTPEDHAPYYTEHFVYMPHCYQVNDHNQSISNKYWKREDFRLPESCFVFCSFNQPYKINPLIFDVWMRILQQISESVLWLLLMNRTAEENLRKEAEARGIKAERLIFADRLPKDEHLARLRFADLALDTQIVNGHTTTSDALWAGVPVLTMQGSHFASRVSSSILSAIGFTELITHSLEEYEALAVKLARNPVELQEIRQRIANNRLVAPLFDTPRFVRNLETAYKEMWKIFLAGEAPKQIEVMES